jgi:CBS domain-containing protein
MGEREPTVSQYMSAPAVIVRDRDSIWHALDRFTVSGLRHLVVLDQQDNFVGVLDDRQMLLACLPLDTVGVHPRSVGQVLRRKAAPASSSDQHVSVVASVQTAAAVMVRQHVDALAVVNARGQVLGVVTMSDLMRAVIDAHLEVPEMSGLSTGAPDADVAAAPRA